MLSDIGVIIVSYNPDLKFLNLLKEFSNKCFVLVVDNASNNKPTYESNNVEFIYNNQNLGLAKALNIGCDYLLNKGFKFAFLLDQDSDISAENLGLLKKTILESKNAIISCPRIMLKDKDRLIEGRYLIKKGKSFVRKKIFGKDPIELFCNITSGTLLNLLLWKKIGCFWDELFIEEIDNEFALRANYYGYRIMLNPNCCLYQQLGEFDGYIKKYGIKWFPTNHSANRYWYQFRNMILVEKRYKHFFRKYFFYIRLAHLRKYLTILAVESDKANKKKAIKSAISDARKIKVTHESKRKKNTIY